MDAKDLTHLCTTKRLRQAAEKAVTEGRLFFCVTDQYGRPSNGGAKPEGVPVGVGKWTEHVEHVHPCVSGYHVTPDPIRWYGCRVWLAELDEVVDSQADKAVGHSRRILAAVYPWDVADDKRLWAATVRPFLRSADLSNANLSNANLSNADLSYADLPNANLSKAYLSCADLSNANLSNANLSNANLSYANLSKAYLSKAYLYGADLTDVQSSNYTSWPAGFTPPE